MTFAVIFDMDGVLVVNHEVHLEAWEAFHKKYNLVWNRERFTSYFGNTNDQILRKIFPNHLTNQEIQLFADEKENLYRSIYAHKIEPTQGLISFLEQLKNANIPLAVATSAPTGNVEFVFEKTGIGSYFSKVVDDSMITIGKPDPEIYLKAAQELGIEPANCFVFEDSHAGIESALRAGMRVIGVATTHRAETLLGVEFVIHDFTGINPGILYKLASTTKKPINEPEK